MRKGLQIAAAWIGRKTTYVTVNVAVAFVHSILQDASIPSVNEVGMISIAYRIAIREAIKLSKTCATPRYRVAYTNGCAEFIA